MPAKSKPLAKPARATPKASPNKGQSVDAWIVAKCDATQTALVGLIRGAVRKAAPKAAESIKWNQPVFESDGPFAFIRVARAHVTLGFWRGTQLADPKGRLEGEGTRMKHHKYTSAADVNAAEIAAWVKQAVQLNATEGTPTR
jgi:hypothetical protein